MSKATGLAKTKDLQGVSDNQQEIRLAQIRDEEEIVKLENKENILLKELKENNHQLVELFHNENNVSESLISVMDEEKSIISKLERIADILELSSDLSIEFNDLLLSISAVESNIQQLTGFMDNLISGKVSLELLDPQVLQKASNFKLTLATATPIFTVKSSYVRITVPMLEEWPLYRLFTVPFGTQPNGLFYKFPINKHIYAVNKNGLTFRFDAEYCPSRNNLHVCAADEVQIHKYPADCGEAVIVNKLLNNHTIPSVCMSDIYLVADPVQEAVALEGKIILFSPKPDTVFKAAGTSLQPVGNVSVGINVLYGSGTFHTSQIIFSNLLYQNTYIDNETVILSDLSKTNFLLII